MPFGPWETFDQCVTEIMQSQGKTEEEAKRICGALQARLEKEAFTWNGELQLSESEGKYLIRGEALHPIKTVHPDEWPSVRIYLKEELEKAAESLSGKPLLLDHIAVLPEPNRVTKAWWDSDAGAIKFEGEVSKEIADKIRDGRIKHVSVDYDWRVLEKVNGVAPREITFLGLSLLEKFQPGDPHTSVELWEGIITNLKVKTWEGLAEKLLHRLEGLSEVLNRISSRFEALEGRIKAESELEKSRKRIVELEGKVKALTEEKAKLEAELKEAQLKASIDISGMIPKEEVIAKLKECVYERTPPFWGEASYRQNLQIKQLIEELSK